MGSKEKNRMLWHYTTMDALIGIIQEKQLCFWATRFDSLNDPSEKIYTEMEIMPTIKKCIEADKNIDESFKDGFQQYPYILSLSRLQDDVLMWRLYHSEVAIVLDINKIPKTYVSHDCEYPNPTRKLTAFLSSYNTLNSDCSDAISQGYQACSFIKHHSFAIEKEYRIVQFDTDCMRITPNPNNIDGFECEDVESPKDVKFRMNSNHELVPYKETLIPKEALVKIVLYTFDDKLFECQKNHIKLLLRSMNYLGVDIEKTTSIEVK